MLAKKLQRMGNSTGISLPKAMMKEVGVEQGDEVLVYVEGGNIVIQPYNKDFQDLISLGEQVMRDNADLLKALAE